MVQSPGILKIQRRVSKPGQSGQTRRPNWKVTVFWAVSCAFGLRRTAVALRGAAFFVVFLRWVVEVAGLFFRILERSWPSVLSLPVILGHQFLDKCFNFT